MQTYGLKIQKIICILFTCFTLYCSLRKHLSCLISSYIPYYYWLLLWLLQLFVAIGAAWKWKSHSTPHRLHYIPFLSTIDLPVDFGTAHVFCWYSINICRCMPGFVFIDFKTNSFAQRGCKWQIPYLTDLR